MTSENSVLRPECSPGSYGGGCEKTCSCPSGVSCDHVTGECQRKCPPGRHGDSCDQGNRRHVYMLPKAHWLQFRPHLLRRVHPVCVSDCPDGRFGSGCVHPCNCTGAPCDKTTGRCNCPAGTSGTHCENCECKEIFH